MLVENLLFITHLLLEVHEGQTGSDHVVLALRNVGNDMLFDVIQG
jgi:hypothetical protein